MVSVPLQPELLQPLLLRASMWAQCSCCAQFCASTWAMSFTSQAHSYTSHSSTITPSH